MTYSPSFARPRRPPRGDDLRAERAPHESVGSMRPSGACLACTSPILGQCTPPTGTACATLRARLCPARPTRDPTCRGGQAAPWGSKSPGFSSVSCPGSGRLILFFFFWEENPEEIPEKKTREKKTQTPSTPFSLEKYARCAMRAVRWLLHPFANYTPPPSLEGYT